MAEEWFLAPVCDAFAPRSYPPPVFVNPEHVGYSVQRYTDGTRGDVVAGYLRLAEAESLAARLNAGETPPVRIRRGVQL